MKQETTNIQNNVTDPFASGPEPTPNQTQPNASLSHTFLGGLGADLVNLDSLGSTSQPIAGTHIRGPSPTNQSNNPFAGVQQNTGNIFSGNVNTNGNIFQILGTIFKMKIEKRYIFLLRIRLPPT